MAVGQGARWAARAALAWALAAAVAAAQEAPQRYDETVLVTPAAVGCKRLLNSIRLRRIG